MENLQHLQSFAQFTSLLESSLYENWAPKLPSGDWRKTLKDIKGLTTSVSGEGKDDKQISWVKKAGDKAVFGTAIEVRKGEGAVLKAKSFKSEGDLKKFTDDLEKFLKDNKVNIKSVSPVEKAKDDSAKTTFKKEIVVDEKDYKKLFQGIEALSSFLSDLH